MFRSELIGPPGKRARCRVSRFCQAMRTTKEKKALATALESWRAKANGLERANTVLKKRILMLEKETGRLRLMVLAGRKRRR